MVRPWSGLKDVLQNSMRSDVYGSIWVGFDFFVQSSMDIYIEVNMLSAAVAIKILPKRRLNTFADVLQISLYTLLYFHISIVSYVF